MTTILLVDDYAPTHRLLRFVLEQRGYSVITAFDGQQALTLLTTASIDLIITDLTMPMMDGLALACEVRSNTRYSDLPIIVLTASGSGLNHAKAAELGVNSFLTKPVASAEMVREVDRLIGLKVKL